MITHSPISSKYSGGCSLDDRPRSIDNCDILKGPDLIVGRWRVLKNRVPCRASHQVHEAHILKRSAAVPLQVYVGKITGPFFVYALLPLIEVSVLNLQAKQVYT